MNAFRIRGELPLLTRDRASRAFNGITHREEISGVLCIDDCVGRIRQRDISCFLCGRKVATNHTLDRSPIGFACGWNINAQQSGAVGRIELPAYPEQRETLIQEKSITEIAGSLRIETISRGEIKETQQALGAPV